MHVIVSFIIIIGRSLSIEDTLEAWEVSFIGRLSFIQRLSGAYQ